MANLNSQQNLSLLRLADSPYRHYFSWLCIFGMFYLTVDAFSYRNSGLFTYLIFLSGIFILFFNKKIGCLYYVVAFILCTDTPYDSSRGFSSIHTTPVFLQTAMANWTSLLCFLVIITISIKKRSLTMRPIDRIIINLGFLFLFAALVGYLNIFDDLRIYISDASYYINMFTAYFMVRLFFSTPSDLKRLLAFVWIALLVWSVFGLINFILGVGVSAGFNIRPFMDTSRILIPFLTLQAFVFYIYRNEIDSKLYSLHLIAGGLAFLNILFFSSRGNIICTAIGFIIILYVSRRSLRSNQIEKKPFWKPVIAIIIFCIGAVLLMQLIRPGSTDYLAWKIQSTAEVNSQANIQNISSANVRWLSAINIFAHLRQEGNLIWGQGLGGWFTDDYMPFTQFLLGGAAFRDDWILSGKLYKPHGIQLFILLKMGLIGIIVYFSILYLIFRESLRIVRLTNDIYWRCTSLALLAFLPLMYYKNFNSKLQLFFGLVVGIISVIGEIHQKKIVQNPRQ